MLILEVVSYKGIAPSKKISAAFDKVGGGIGRGDINALILPDADRYISRMHARISYRSGRYFIEDHGTATPVIVNKRILGKGVDSTIDHGDEVRIGDYGLRVVVQDHAPTPAAASGAALDEATGSDPLAETRAIVARPEAVPPGRASIPLSEARALRNAVQPDTLDTPADPMAQTQRFTQETAVQDVAVRAFFDGTGMTDQTVLSRLTPQSLYVAGQLLRESLQALMDLQLVQAILKRELPMEATANPATGSNPFMLASDVDVVLSHLLNPPPGSMPPIAAVQAVGNDLRAHQFALMEGVRAALHEILNRFDPQSLEQRSMHKTAFGALLPGQNKARLWDQFSESYREMSQQAESDFHAVFGREFMRFYEAHFNERLRIEREKSG